MQNSHRKYLFQKMCLVVDCLENNIFFQVRERDITPTIKKALEIKERLNSTDGIPPAVFDDAIFFIDAIDSVVENKPKFFTDEFIKQWDSIKEEKQCNLKNY